MADSRRLAAVVLSAGTESLKQRGRQHRRGRGALDGGVGRPAAFAGVGYAARERPQVRVLCQRAGRQIEQPRADDAPAPPQLGDLWEGELYWIVLGVAQRSRLGVRRAARVPASACARMLSPSA